MSAPPALTELADTYPLPSNATFKGGITKLLNYALGLLGSTGNAAEARVALGIGPVISFRNLLINGNFAINQRGYATGVATTVANQYTLDRWRVVTSGQNVAFGAAAPDRTVTAPAGGLEQVIEGANIVGGIYTLSWVGAGTAKVNGTAIANGGNTASLPANTNVTVQFVGAVSLAQFEFGTVATPFERKKFSQELADCKRYFRIQACGFIGTATSATAYGGTVVFEEMRASPTPLYLDDGTNVNFTGGSGQLNVTVVNATSAEFYKTASGTGGARYYTRFTLTAEL